MQKSDGSINEAPGSGSDRTALIKELSRNFDLELAERLSATELETLLADKLNELIRTDFNTLVTILYRVDVNEAKLKELLRTSAGEDAGRIMARLIIERQEQKIKTREASGAAGTGPIWKDL